MPLLAVALAAVVISQEVEEFSAVYDGGRGQFNIRGFRPVGPGPHPLFMYVQGTYGNYWSNDAQLYARHMAENGVVGTSVQYEMNSYPSLCSGFEQKARSMFEGSGSALGTLCSLGYVNCTAGVVLAGLSQGAQLVSLAQNYAAPGRVSGIYEIGGGYSLGGPATGFACLRYENLAIDQSRIRSGAGETDGFFGKNPAGVTAQQIAITGYTCTGTSSCFAADGSGWVVVSAAQTGLNAAGHCYQYILPVCFPAIPGSVYLSTDESWGFHANFDWLIAKTDRTLRFTRRSEHESNATAAN
ncbi:hypothetical protein DIPPA_27044 [Diplonema papillatum]|nr:hypothetical protein DIPPA_27044 [Diplonema papillatum]